MKLYLLVFVYLAGSVVAYEQYIGNARHPDHPGKCYHKDTNYALEIGEEYRPVQKEVCAKYTCRDDFVIRINHCPRYQVPQNCMAHEGDHSKPFPKCCATLECLNNETGDSEIRETFVEIQH